MLAFERRMGRIEGMMEGLPEETRMETAIDLMVAEAVKTSEIEGEYISRKDVMSSIKNNLKLNQPIEQIRDKRAEGVAELMLDVRNSYSEPITVEKLFSWHCMIMRENRFIEPGKWRTHAEPMQVVSGAIGKEKVHYEAPPSDMVPAEMERFIRWFNDTKPKRQNRVMHPLVRSALAHLHFETIHPFEDGNGRLGRAVSEKALSQGAGYPVLLSLSRTIEQGRSAYYDALKVAQRSNETTSWISYFADMALEAQTQAEKSIEFTLKKARFFSRFESSLNERQLRVVRRMLDEGPKGFKGGMSAKKYIAITRTSKATATRDLQDLTNKGAFSLSGRGRSTRYKVNLG